MRWVVVVLVASCAQGPASKGEVADAAPPDAYVQYPTNVLLAQIVADTDGSNTTVSARFVESPSSGFGGHGIALDGSDMPLASVADARQLMGQSCSCNHDLCTPAGCNASCDPEAPDYDYLYAASFAGGSAGDNVVVDLAREARHRARRARPGSCRRPSYSASPPTSMSRSADLTLTWTSAASSVPITWTVSGPELRYGGECSPSINGATGTVAAGDTSLTIPANTLQLTDAAVSGSAFTVTIELDRRVPGSLDPAYAGGTIVAVQSRTIQLTSNP